MEERPPIPADLRRRIYVEAGHRCAIPTCRHLDIDVHHIIPWAQCLAHDYENLIALCPNCHRRADNGEIDRKALRLYKYNLRFLHDKYSQTEMDVLFELYGLKRGVGLLWPPFMHILLKRLLDSKFIDIQSPSNDVIIGGMRTNPDTIFITDWGRKFVQELGLREVG
jgi:hypothetical protein